MRMTAIEAVACLKRREVTPLELIEAAERRIAEVEPVIKACAAPHARGGPCGGR